LSATLAAQIKTIQRYDQRAKIFRVAKKLCVGGHTTRDFRSAGLGNAARVSIRHLAAGAAGSRTGYMSAVYARPRGAGLKQNEIFRTPKIMLQNSEHSAQ
jgi:hypothetical protein